MSVLQNYLATDTQKAMGDLKTALLRLPQDKRDWQPETAARSALDMVAECAVMNANTAALIRTRVFPADFNMAAYAQERARLRADWNTLDALLQSNTDEVMASIRAVPDADLELPITMPWGTMPLTQVLAYPSWNMTYHAAQINYIASLLGLL